MSQASRPSVPSRLGIIVVAFNAVDVLERNIGAMAIPADALVVIADNSTKSSNRAAIERFSADRGWHYVGIAGNPGFGAGVNIGVDAALSAECSELLILNPDASIDLVGIEALRRASTEAGLLSPRIVRSDGKDWFRSGSLDLVKGVAYHSTASEPEWLSGACLFVSAGAWRKLRGFDTRYFLYWEDVDLSHRWVQYGGVLRVVEEATAVHEVGATQIQDADYKPRSYFFYNARNRILFAFSRLGLGRATLWVLLSPLYWRRLLRRGRPGIGPRMRDTAAMIQGTFGGVRLAFSSSGKAELR